MKMKKERELRQPKLTCVYPANRTHFSLYSLLSLLSTHPLIDAPSWAYPIKSSVQRITKSELSAANSKQLRPQ